MKKIYLGTFLYLWINMLLGQATNVFPDNNNVGIGTLNPISKLHISNGETNGENHYMSDLTIEDDDHAMINLLTTNSKNGYYAFSDSNDNYLGGMQYEHASNLLRFRVNNHNTNMIINGNGNIGMGIRVTNPYAQLVVGSHFGAIVSGSSGGNALFGTNMAFQQDGGNHNKIYTPYTHTSNYGYAGVRASWGKILFYTEKKNTMEREVITPIARMIINEFGNIGIGTNNPDSKLSVNGKIHAKEVKIDLSIPAPDYVFKKEYNLLSIPEVQNYIRKNGHLPNIPSAKVLEKDGVSLGIMNMKLLEKIEELTLYTIAQEHRINEQKQKNKKLESRIERLEKMLLKN
ncbi:hypothetical protein ACFSTE_14805 [Aquimarina hainanensis]|uniref:Peptidase S74 domain-containing protein n=1 Tax=Aquimarina hainanensis TaxID=1578017 RepID=A0ABW5NA46_9FLAO